MKPHALVAAFLLLGISPLFIQAEYRQPSSESSARRNLVILPGGGSGGAITAQSSEIDLIRMYGSENVAAQDVDLGEGETERGTELFSNDPQRRIDILWKDLLEKRGPKRIQISGAKSLWTTVHRISLGTTLKQLEQINRKPFRLAGFAFDYSGTVISWSQGALEQELDGPGRVILRLEPSQDQSQQPDYRSVLGDGSFSSGHPAMQRLNPCVYQLIWLIP
jgi:hypothetical protein